MADGATTNDLADDNGAVRASGGTIQLPQPLAAGSWGFAVAGLGGFDLAYESLPNVASVWAGVPLAGSTASVVMSSGPVSATALPAMMSCAPTWLCRRRD